MILDQVRRAIQAKDIRQAQLILAEYLISHPKDEEGWLLFADILPRDKALESLERVLKVNPDNVEARAKFLFLTESASPEWPKALLGEEDIPEFLEVDPTLEEKGRSSLLEGELDTVSPASQSIPDQVEIESELLTLPEDLPISIFEEEPLTNSEAQHDIESLEDLLIQVKDKEISPSLIQETQNNGEQVSTILPIADEQVVEEVPAQINQTDESKLEGDVEPVANTGEIASEGITGPEEISDKPNIEQLSEEVSAPMIPSISINEVEEPVLTSEVPKSKEEKKAKPLFNRFAIVLTSVLVVICVLVTSGVALIYFYGPCGVQSVLDADQKIADIKTRWDQTFWVANKSSRVTLAQPVLEMVNIQQELRKIQVPACMEPAKTSLDQSMKYTIEAYDRFFRYENELEVRKRFNNAAAQRKLFEQQMQTIYQCAPFSCP
jgi:hypothetical protein